MKNKKEEEDYYYDEDDELDGHYHSQPTIKREDPKLVVMTLALVGEGRSMKNVMGNRC